MRAPFALIRDHVLLDQADEIERADDFATEVLGADWIAGVLNDVPDELLEGDATELRARYVAWLMRRLEGPREFAAEAARAREAKLATPTTRLRTRR
jgi:hypothetical protein